MYRHILIPTDGSRLSEKAVKAGIALAKTLGSTVVAFHMFHINFMTAATDLETVDSGTLAKLRDAARQAGEKVLEQVKNQAHKAGVECRGVLLQGEAPWEGIIETARKRKCDLIVMAAHGYQGLRALLLGSETDKVLTHSKIPVVVYR